jgi:hypothetical protein
MISVVKYLYVMPNTTARRVERKQNPKHASANYSVPKSRQTPCLAVYTNCMAVFTDTHKIKAI